MVEPSHQDSSSEVWEEKVQAQNTIVCQFPSKIWGLKYSRKQVFQKDKCQGSLLHRWLARRKSWGPLWPLSPSSNTPNLHMHPHFPLALRLTALGLLQSPWSLVEYWLRSTFMRAEASVFYTKNECSNSTQWWNHNQRLKGMSNKIIKCHAIKSPFRKKSATLIFSRPAWLLFKSCHQAVRDQKRLLFCQHIHFNEDNVLDYTVDYMVLLSQVQFVSDM